MEQRPVRVCLPIFPECDPSIVYGVFDTLWSAGRLWDWLHGRPAGNGFFNPRLVGAMSGPIVLATGVTISVQDAVEDVKDTKIVFVPNVLVSSPDELSRLDPAVLDWIRRMHQDGAHLYAACGGALVLAAAGLLDGLETTTHWAYAPLLRQTYPTVKVLEDRIIVHAGPGHRITCAGGASSWQDLSLLLIARHMSSVEAIRVSKIFLYQWHREGQRPFSSLLNNMDHSDRVIRVAQIWLAEHYPRHDVLHEVVRRSELPTRTFDRRFKQATGQSPLSYVQALRIEGAKHLLEATEIPVEAIAAQVGYEDARSFRRLFLRLTSMYPRLYRRKFQLPAPLDDPTGYLP